MSNNVVELIIAAKNMADQALNAAAKALGMVGDEAKEADEGLGKGEKAAGKLGATMKEIMPTFAALRAEVGNFKPGPAFESAKASLQGLAARIKELPAQAAGGLKSLASMEVSLSGIGRSALSGIKSLGSIEVSMGSMFLAAAGGVMIFKNLASGIVDSMKRAAEGGDKSAQAIFGGFENIRRSVDDVVSKFTKDFAPAILPLVGFFVDLAKQVAKWAEQSGAGKVIAQGLIETVLTLGTAFERMLSIAITGMVKLMQVAADVSSVFSDDVANDIDASAASVAKFGKSWDETAATLETKLALIATGQKDLTATQVDELAKQSEAYEKHTEVVQKAAEEKKRLAEEQQKLIQEETDKRRDDLQATMDLELKMAGDNKELQLQIWKDYFETLKLEYGEHSDQVSEALVTIRDLELGITAERLEGLDMLKKGYADVSTSVTNYAQHLAESLGIVTVKTKEGLAAQKKATAELIKDAHDRAVKTLAIAQQGANILFNSEMNFNQKLKSIASETTKSLLADMQKRVMEGIALKRAEQVSHTTADTAEKISALGSVPAKIAGWAAHIPWPLGGVLAAAAFAALSSLAAKVLKFADGGMISDRLPGGVIPGTGGGDRYLSALRPQELVLTQEAMSDPQNRRMARAMNNGASASEAAATAGASGGEMRVIVIHEHRGGFPPPVEWYDRIIPQFADRLSHAVLNKGVTVVASHYRDATS